MRGSVRLVLATLLAALVPLSAARADGSDSAGEGTRVEHTPWLALRFLVDGAAQPMTHVDTLDTVIHLPRRPFTIVLPVRGDDDTYWIAGWTDPGIRDATDVDARRSRLDRPPLPPFFAPGTGMADTAAGSGTLMLNLEGHNHLDGLRLGPDLDRHTFHVSEVMVIEGFRDSRTYRVEDAPSPLYLVAWYDEDGDGVMRHGEYEFLTLVFDQP